MHRALESSDLFIVEFFLLEQFVYFCGSELTHNSNQQANIIKRNTHSLAPKNNILFLIFYYLRIFTLYCNCGENDVYDLYDGNEGIFINPLLYIS